MAKGRKTGGRVAGTPNKVSADGREHVRGVLAELLQKHKVTIEDLSVALLVCGNPVVIQKEIHALREWLYGKAIQPIQEVDQPLGDGNLYPITASPDDRNTNRPN